MRPLGRTSSCESSSPLCPHPRASRRTGRRRYVGALVWPNSAMQALPPVPFSVLRAREVEPVAVPLCQEAVPGLQDEKPFLCRRRDLRRNPRLPLRPGTGPLSPWRSPSGAAAMWSGPKSTGCPSSFALGPALVPSPLSIYGFLPNIAVAPRVLVCAEHSEHPDVDLSREFRWSG